MLKNIFVRVIATLALVLVLSGIGGTEAPGSPLQLLPRLLEALAKKSDDMARHGDDVLRQAMPEPNANLVPTLPQKNPNAKGRTESLSGSTNTAPTTNPPANELYASQVIGRTAARTYKHCRSAKTFSRDSEILRIVGSNVNLRSCGSTNCSILGNITNGGRFEVNAIDQDRCWIKFEYENTNNGRLIEAFVYEKNAIVE